MKNFNLTKIFDFFKGKKLFFVGLCIAFMVILVDQYTKYKAMKAVEYIISKTNGVHTHIKKSSFFNLVLVWNRGVSFGLFNNNNNFVLIFVLLIILIIITYVFYNLWKNDNLLQMICYSLVLGGAIGNIMDRCFYGAVVDFLDFHVGKLHWPAFNVADSCICVGIGLYLLDDLVKNDKKKGKK